MLREADTFSGKLLLRSWLRVKSWLTRHMPYLGHLRPSLSETQRQMHQLLAFLKRTSRDVSGD